jgi:mycothiol system anti-sigma-R factor
MRIRKRRAPESISCSEALNRLFDYLDEELRGWRREEFKKHLEECRHCFSRFEFERLLKSRLRNLKVGDNAGRLRERVEALLEQF